MLVVQMWPPADGSHKTLSFEGRTYSSTPGIPIPVQSFDVPVLEANGWRQFSLVPGASTDLMTIAPGGKTQATVVNGRQYSCAPGNFVSVPSMDRNTLEANGWVRVTNTSFTNVVSAISAPAGAIGLYSVVRIAGWNGFCLQVRRQDGVGATMDIGFVGNVVDWASADAFANGAPLEVSIWYDQSGTGNNFICATLTRGPLFQRESHWKGIRPLSAELINLGTPTRFIGATFSVAPDQNLITVYQIASPRSSFNLMVAWSSETAAFAGLRMNLADQAGAATGIQQNRLSSNTSINIAGMSNLCTKVFSSGPTSLIDIDGVQVSVGAPVSQSIPCMTLFSATNGTTSTENFLGDIFFMAVYPANHSGATVTANRATFLAPFAPNTHTKALIYGGNSMQVASRSTRARSLAWLGGFGRTSEDDGGAPFTLPARPEWRVRNTGVSGRTLANEIAHWSGGKLGTNIVDTGMQRVVYVSGSPTNDIGAGTYASTAAAQAAMDTLYASWLTHVTAVKTAGVNGFVTVTCIPRTTFQLGTGNFREDARVYWNSLILGGAVAHGYLVSDWCSLAPYNTASSAQNAAFYYSDMIHPNDAGYALIAVLDTATILAA